MSTASIDASDADLDYSGSRKDSPASLRNSPELAENPVKLEQMQEDAGEEFEGVSPPMDIFTQTNKIDSMDLANEEANMAATPPRQQRYVIALDPDILTKITSNRIPRSPGLASDMSPR